MAKKIAGAGNGFLTDLVMEIKGGNLRRCESIGLNQEEIRMLNNITIEDLYYLSCSTVSVITFQIHHENLFLILEQSRLEQERNQCIERALALGASTEMINRYFGLVPFEVSARRRLAGIRVSVGRSSNLSEEDTRIICQRWQKAKISNVNSHDGLEMMMLLAEELSVSLTATWNVIQKLLESESQRLSSLSKKKYVVRR
ncbi:DUF2857 domain-containing protein [Xenorhabdus khoisanae]|uniref:DUF2857 domain-containing protein n=1 Tax=Xenorhabdus khoisanae TaxID=880157 RepID=UPI0023598CAD|nr:DUF2857 domain-containing protein [Xenorhabdus khoisanae]MDC9612941.1 DUF2857 domain-containing protein [Xenorhabdus khoisanae]